uniref:BAR domain-containing protein n=1 Tax=Romanomermis culicivorax TaxID=13658 RepID=A0A915I6N2_ROMCU
MASKKSSLAPASGGGGGSGSGGGGSSASPSNFRAAWLKFKHILLNVEQTEFHSDFVQMVEDAKELGCVTKLLIKAIKNNAQPNPAYQSTLFYTGGIENDYEQLMRVLNEYSAVVMNKSTTSGEFAKKLSKAMYTCNAANSNFLKQTQSNVIKTLETYVELHLKHILSEYRKLQSAKSDYDDAKNQLRLCKPERIDRVNDLVKNNKMAFETQANYVTDLLNKIPDHVEEQRKALRIYINALRVKVMPFRHETCQTTMVKLLQETATDVAPTPQEGGGGSK